jgi:hypothetical protein
MGLEPWPGSVRSSWCFSSPRILGMVTNEKLRTREVQQPAQGPSAASPEPGLTVNYSVLLGLCEALQLQGRWPLIPRASRKPGHMQRPHTGELTAPPLTTSSVEPQPTSQPRAGAILEGILLPSCGHEGQSRHPEDYLEFRRMRISMKWCLF